MDDLEVPPFPETPIWGAIPRLCDTAMKQIKPQHLGRLSSNIKSQYSVHAYLSKWGCKQKLKTWRTSCTTKRHIHAANVCHCLPGSILMFSSFYPTPSTTHDIKMLPPITPVSFLLSPTIHQTFRGEFNDISGIDFSTDPRGPPFLSQVTGFQVASARYVSFISKLLPVDSFAKNSGLLADCIMWYTSNITVKPLSLPAPTPTTCPNIKKHCVLWDKMHMSMIMAFILQRTA